CLAAWLLGCLAYRVFNTPGRAALLKMCASCGPASLGLRRTARVCLVQAGAEEGPHAAPCGLLPPEGAFLPWGGPTAKNSPSALRASELNQLSATTPAFPSSAPGACRTHIFSSA